MPEGVMRFRRCAGNIYCDSSGVPERYDVVPAICRKDMLWLQQCAGKL